MSQSQIPCPPDTELANYVDGKMSEHDSSFIEKHLGSCNYCVQRLGKLNTTDSLVLALGGDCSEIPESAAKINQLVAQMQVASSHRQTDIVGSNSTTLNSVRQSGLAELLRGASPPESPDELARLGEFHLLKLIGQGGMGAVFLARDSKLDRYVAVKLINPALAHAGGADRFLREGRAIAALKHQHIVTVYQVGQAGEVAFMAQEYLEGETLETRLKREGPLPLQEISRIGRQIAEGLAHAHSKGFIHRDIKPANIWLEAPNGAVKILDFGLARPIFEKAEECATLAASSLKWPELTTRGLVVGTPCYMSPEQARGEELNAASDLFSFGIVLFQMATGRTPFAARTVPEVLAAINFQHPPALSSHRGDLPASLSELVLRLLAKKATERPTSMADVAEVLAQLDSISRRSLLRSPWSWAAMTLAFILAYISWFLYLTSSPEPDPERTLTGKWSAPHFWLERDSAGSWTERSSAGFEKQLEERELNADFVDLYDKEEQLELRLSPVAAYQRRANQPFQVRSGGRWHIPVKGVQADPLGSWAGEDGTRLDCDSQRVWTSWPSNKHSPQQSGSATYFEIARNSEYVEIGMPNISIRLMEGKLTQATSFYSGLPTTGRWLRKPDLSEGLPTPLWRSEPRIVSRFEVDTTPREVPELSTAHLCFVSDDGKLHAWNYTTQKVTSVMSLPSSVKAIGWIDRGNMLAYVADDTIYHTAARGTAQPVGKIDSISNNWATLSYDDGRVIWSKKRPGFMPEFIEADRNGKQIRKLGVGYDACWSADGKRFAFLTFDRAWRIAYRDGDKMEAFEVPIHSKLAVFPALSPDGKEIAFSMAGADGSQQIGIFDIGRKQLRQVTNDSTGHILPTYSLDGTLLAFLRGADPDRKELVVLNLTSKEANTIATKVQCIRPTWWSLAPRANASSSLGMPLGILPETSALHFDGIDDRVEIPMLAFDGKAATVELWVKRETHELAIPLDWVGPAHRIGFFLQNGKSGFAAGGLEGGKVATSQVLDQAWTHLAGTFDGNECSYFINGKRIPAKVTRPNPPRGLGLFLGCRRGVGTIETFDDHFCGLIDEVRISRGVRYNEDFVPRIRNIADENTVALFHFDDASGDTAVDSSPNKNHGKIYGATWVESRRQ